MFGESAAVQLKEKFLDDILDVQRSGDQAVVFVNPERTLDACRFLHDEPSLLYEYLSDITAVDLHLHEPRFHVVYHLYSFNSNDWLRLKVPVYSADPTLPSVTEIWRGANWLEREVFDMFGIVFDGHPNLTRILMPDDWNGHPLRKDFPLLGNADETVLLFDDVRDVLG